MTPWTASQDHLRFSETDMSGWAHNSHFMRFVENAEHELLYSLGQHPVDQEVGWPRVNFTIDFRSPLVLNDPYQVILKLNKLGNSSVTWGFTIMSDQRLVAEGQMTSVQVGRDGKSKPISEELKAKIKDAFNL